MCDSFFRVFLRRVCHPIFQQRWHARAPKQTESTGRLFTHLESNGAQACLPLGIIVDLRGQVKDTFDAVHDSLTTAHLKGFGQVRAHRSWKLKCCWELECPPPRRHTTRAAVWEGVG